MNFIERIDHCDICDMGWPVGDLTAHFCPDSAGMPTHVLSTCPEGHCIPARFGVDGLLEAITRP